VYIYTQNRLIYTIAVRTTMDTQSKTEMVNYLYTEYMRVCSSGYLNSMLYDVPIESIDGVKLDKARLRLSPFELELFVEIRNADNANLICLQDCGTYQIIKDTRNRGVIKEADPEPDEQTRLTKLSFVEGVDKLVDVISKLIFNVEYGRLVYCVQNWGHPPLPDCFKKLATLGKAEWKDKDCCVCLETTNTRFAPCKHRICGRCVSNLNRVTCPICRADYDCHESSSDDEE